jgi:uracil-DNA glycosylase
MVLVGEQPGDREDLEGEPFVGPAGALLSEALAAAGIDPALVYLTNAVKHFRFEERGKQRLHKTPDLAHIRACKPWLTAELKAVRPDVVVCLGATAGRAVLGRAVRVGAERGRLLEAPGGTPNETAGTARVLLTTHPSAVLRLRGRSEYPEAFDLLVSDLAVAAAALEGGSHR